MADEISRNINEVSAAVNHISGSRHDVLSSAQDMDERATGLKWIVGIFKKFSSC